MFKEDISRASNLQIKIKEFQRLRNNINVKFSAAKLLLASTSPEMMIKVVVSLAVTGMVYGSVFGSMGAYGLSFFNPAISETTNIATLAAVGALENTSAFCLFILSRCLINEITFLKYRPISKILLISTLELILGWSCTIAATVMLGLPVGPTVCSYMIIPTIIYSLGILIGLIIFLALTNIPAHAPAAPEPIAVADNLGVAFQ